MYIPNKDIYFAGGAYGMIYHLGIINKLKLNTNIKVYGISSGALVGMLYLLQYPKKKQIKLYNYLSDNSNDKIKENPLNLESYDITPNNFYALKKIIDDYPDAYKILTDKLYIGITTIDENNKTYFVWKHTFDSNLDLCNALLCGFHIPFLCNYDSKINNNLAIDGMYGFNENIYLSKDILKFGITSHCKENYCITGNIPLEHCIFPIPKNYREKYFTKGVNDITNYITKNQKVVSKHYFELNDRIIPIPLFVLLRKLQKENKKYNIKTLQKYLDNTNGIV